MKNQRTLHTQPSLPEGKKQKKNRNKKNGERILEKKGGSLHEIRLKEKNVFSRKNPKKSIALKKIIQIRVKSLFPVFQKHGKREKAKKSTLGGIKSVCSFMRTAEKLAPYKRLRKKSSFSNFLPTPKIDSFSKKKNEWKKTKQKNKELPSNPIPFL